MADDTQNVDPNEALSKFFADIGYTGSINSPEFLQDPANKQVLGQLNDALSFYNGENPRADAASSYDKAVEFYKSEDGQYVQLMLSEVENSTQLLGFQDIARDLRNAGQPSVYETSIKQLMSDADLQPVDVDLDRAVQKSQVRMGVDIAAAYGATLAQLQNAAPGTPEHAAYQDIVEYTSDENQFGFDVRTDFESFGEGAEFFANIAKGASPEDEARRVVTGQMQTFLDKLNPHIDAATVAKATLSIGGVNTRDVDAFVTRLENETPEVRARIENVMDAVVNNLSAPSSQGVDVTADDIRTNIASMQPFLQTMTWNGGSTFFNMMRTDAAGTLTDTITSHLKNDGALDADGLQQMVNAVPNKMELLAEVAGLNPSETQELQGAFDKMQSADPRFANYFSDALNNEISHVMSGKVSIAGGALDAASGVNPTRENMANLRESLKPLLGVISSDAVNDFLTDPKRQERLFAEIDEINAAAATDPDNVLPVNLQRMGGLMAEDIAYNEIGRTMVTLPDHMQHMVGYAGMMGIGDQLKRLGQMGDGTSSNILNANSLFGMQLLSGQGLGGFMGGFGNSFDYLNGALATVGQRFGFDTDPSITATMFAAHGNSYIFDDIDYGKIAQNRLNGHYNPDGTVATEEQKNMTPAERLMNQGIEAAAKVAGVPPDTVQKIKDAANQGLDEAGAEPKAETIMPT